MLEGHEGFAAFQVAKALNISPFIKYEMKHAARITFINQIDI